MGGGRSNEKVKYDGCCKMVHLNPKSVPSGAFFVVEGGGVMSAEKYPEVSSRPSWIILAFLVIGFVNQALVLLGYSPLPFSEGDIETLLVTGYNVTVGIIAWYKNMPTSKEGRIGTAVTRQLKKDKGIH